MSARFHGLTWDHPRGFNALHRAGQDSGLIAWDKHSLEGFESAPIGELCTQYDLVVLDHPHLGEACEEECLRPLEDIFAADDLVEIEQATIGPCYASYAMNGKHWALPLDAASQVMAVREDLSDPTIETWDDVIVFTKSSGKVALSLAGPHAVLTLLSIAASLDDEPFKNDGWLSPEVCRQAFEILAEVHADATTVAADKNPIGILEHMANSDDIALCPLIYGYVNYAAQPNGRAIAFRNAPRSRPDGRPGSILGGTGISVSARCREDESLWQHLLWLMSTPVQIGFIPENDGQPSSRVAWHDPTVNVGARNFYADTVETLERAAVRPRYAGYITFQTQASTYLSAALTERAAPASVASDLGSLHRQSLTYTSGKRS